ncbi:serine/threonine-protein kinase [Streptomyces sp. NPDC001663]|uniref:serine/threonine-protein kinase n=1 Tax=Streptomyces sp. NPDC001663 TaxID=3364597 RepID=UPI0036B65B3E
MRIGGRYHLTESVGQGGMGRVWRARDEVLQRPVAVKELRLDDLDGHEDPRTRRERALREARASARVDHPGVVRVYDVAEEDDRLWIVMELVEAPSLERTVAEDGPLGVRETARVGLALAQALRRVHAAGVLHRDVKPGNVLLGAGGRVVLTDFGIAAVQDAQSLTGTVCSSAPRSTCHRSAPPAPARVPRPTGGPSAPPSARR